jgi:selenoprotein W-related protein
MTSSGPRVAITYCTQCRWLLRAAWYAQELLTTFHRELGEVALRPGTGGVFVVEAWPAAGAHAPADEAASDGPASDGPAPDDGARPGRVVVWDRSVDGGFPDVVELKRRIRDVVAPDKPLGHADRLAEERPDE